MLCAAIQSSYYHTLASKKILSPMATLVMECHPVTVDLWQPCMDFNARNIQKWFATA